MQPAQGDCLPPHDDQAPSLTIAEYAEITGLSEKTVRRKVRQGTIAAVMVTGPYGPEYRIVQGREAPSPPVPRQPPRSGQADSLPGQAPSLDSLVALVDRLSRENLELAGRCGFYQSEIQHLHAQLEDARAQIALLSAPVSAMADTPDTPHEAPPTQANQAPMSAIADMPADQAQVGTAHRSAPEQNGPDSASYTRRSRPWWHFWAFW